MLSLWPIFFLAKNKKSNNLNYKMANKPKVDMVVYDAIPIISDNWKEEIWNYIKYCENEENLKRYYKDNTGRESNARRVQHVKFCISQARSYFESSKNAPVNVKPLIQFYGVSSFAKAIILLLSKFNPSQISDIHNSHGISLNFSSADKDLGHILLKVNKNGVFPQFNNIVKNQGYFNVNMIKQDSSGTNSKFFKYKSSDSTLLSGNNFNAKGLLSCLPEIAMHYYLNYRERNNVFLLNKSEINIDNMVKLEVKDFDMTSYTTVDEGILKKHFPTRPSLHKLTSSFLFDKTTDYIPIYRAVTGEQYLIGDINNITINEISVLYLISFILGMVVRYRPDTWERIISQEGALIYGFLELCQTKFPLLAINILTQYVFAFGIPVNAIIIP